MARTPAPLRTAARLVAGSSEPRSSVASSQRRASRKYPRARQNGHKPAANLPARSASRFWTDQASAARTLGCSASRRSSHWTWSVPRSARSAPSARDRKSTRLNSSHTVISYAVFCLKKKKKKNSTVARKTEYVNIVIQKHTYIQHAQVVTDSA